MRYINNDFGTIRYFVTAKSCIIFARTWMEVRIPKIPQTEKYKTFENNKQHYQVNPMYCTQQGAENFDSHHHTALQCGESLTEVALAIILYSSETKSLYSNSFNVSQLMHYNEKTTKIT